VRIVIDSDMSGEGTTIKIDGRTITEDEDITSVAFMAYNGDEPYASFSYTSRELDENGINEIVRYSATKGDAFERAAYAPLGRTEEATAEDHLKAPRLGTKKVEDSASTPKPLRVSSTFLKEWRRMEDSQKEREKREKRIKDLNSEEDGGDDGEPG